MSQPFRYEKREQLNEEKPSYEMVVNARKEKMADKIETNKTIAYLEYDIAKDKVEPEDALRCCHESTLIKLANIYIFSSGII